MYANERHHAILDVINNDGRASVQKLADFLDVVPETIRRDLSILERQGLLRRVHGGAIPIRRLGYQPTVASRSSANVAEKQRIAQAAMAEVPDEGAILIDSGTTTGHLISLLPNDRNLTVVTNSVQHAMLLAAMPNIKLLMLGGRVEPRTYACLDSWAVKALAGLCADVAFVGTDGFTLERGLTTPDRAEAEVKAAMLAAARRKVVLADSSKVGNNEFACFGKIEDIDVLITDTGLDTEAADAIEMMGPTVVLA